MRYKAGLATIALTLGLIPGLGAAANEPMKDPNAAPDSAKYTVHEFAFEGLRVWDGKRESRGSEKIWLAVPKLVNCESTYLGNECKVFLRASAQTTYDFINKTWNHPDFHLELYEPGATFHSKWVVVTPFFENGKPIGSGWSQATMEFMVKESATFTLRVRKDFGEPYLSIDIPLVVSAKTQAQKDAELEQWFKEKAREVANTKYTITCKAGSKSKKITGDPPVCPKGYVNPMSKHSAFQAFVKCKLYKKTGRWAYAQLRDSGRTLDVFGYGNGIFVDDLNQRDWECLAKSLGIPSKTLTQISKTRAIDGMLSARFGKMTAVWTFHPDDGLNISFVG